MLHRIVILTCCLLATSPAWSARLALVIGNADYSEGRLKNPVNDARAMDAKLAGLGFKVTKVENLTRKQIGKTVNGFASQIKAGDDVVVFYAGHGVQLKGINYFPAVDADIGSEEDVPLNSLNLNTLMERLDEAKAGVKLLLLDACRNNPYARSFRSGERGLARVTGASSGTLIHYATRPGSVAADGDGSNGLYTSQLLKQIDTPDLAVEQLFKRVGSAVKSASKGQQEPWVEGSLEGDFYFASSSTRPTATLANLDVRPGPKPPVSGGLNLSDLHAQEEAERQQKKQWSEWQSKMKQDFVALQQSSLSPERQLKAWERFLESYGQDNPYSNEDDSLRQQAQAQQTQLQQSLTAAATPASVPASRPTVTTTSNQAQTGQSFRDCNDGSCPEMVWIPKGSFMMGSNEYDNEKPVHQVSINYDLAVSKYPVTFDQWDACVAASGCSERAEDRGWGRGNRPVISVNWDDAQQYVKWLSRKTGKGYRLLSEAEWEFAARAGTSTRYYWGDTASHDYANYGRDECCGGYIEGRDQWINTSPVGSFSPNPWGLYDMAGNVWNWVEDCWNDSYGGGLFRSGAPNDGSAWMTGECSRRVLRGGSWGNDPAWIRSAFRSRGDTAGRGLSTGIRVARTG